MTSILVGRDEIMQALRQRMRVGFRVFESITRVGKIDPLDDHFLHGVFNKRARFPDTSAVILRLQSRETETILSTAAKLSELPMREGFTAS